MFDFDCQLFSLVVLGNNIKSIQIEKTIGQFYPYFCKLVLVYYLFNEIKIKLAGQIKIFLLHKTSKASALSLELPWEPTVVAQPDNSSF